jgi:hypothetical protein
MHLQRRERLRRGGPSRPRQTLFGMKNRPSNANRGPRQQPLDHLKPGDRARNENEDAQPAAPSTPGAGDAEAVRGKATSSPAATATRPHLEGSEQGPS